MSFRLGHVNTTPKVVAPLPLRPADSTLLCLVLSTSGPAVPFSRDAPIAGTMNGFSEQGLDEDAFGASKGGIASFDAFRKCFLFMQELKAMVGKSHGTMRDHAHGSVQWIGSLRLRMRLTPRSEDQKDIPHPRPRFVILDRSPPPDMHLPLLVRDNPLVGGFNDPDLLRRERRRPRHADQHRHCRRDELRRPPR